MDDGLSPSGRTRRRLLSSLAAVSALSVRGLDASSFPARAAAPEAAPRPPPEPQTFVAGHVKALAADLAARPFSKPTRSRPPPFDKLTPEQFRDLRLKPGAALWQTGDIGYAIEPLPMGWIYDIPVELWIVEGGKALALEANSRLFDFGPTLGQPSPDAPYGFSGFRVMAPGAIAHTFEEVVTFQGATYFKAVGRGQETGASARGLAINTAQPAGEEFPIFRAFWIEKPPSPAEDLRVYALLDSDSTTGAFAITIRPGQAAVMDIEATLIPRRPLAYLGLAPLTSMFMHGPADTRPVRDIRPAVHNSEGLAIVNGSGEYLWRPLRNPSTLQTSAFVDAGVRGFGLAQRQRAFEAFDDLDAHYERRPTVWVEPKGNWGRGLVELIEIPAAGEIHDNIVAYWKPEAPVTEQISFAYRLSWGAGIPVAWAPAFARETRTGDGPRGGTVRFLIDFAGPALRRMSPRPAVDLTANQGAIENMRLEENPIDGGVRVEFDLDPRGTEMVELRLALKHQDEVISETWLYRWTKA